MAKPRLGFLKVSMKTVLIPVIFTLVLFLLLANSAYLSEPVRRANECLVDVNKSKCKNNTCPSIQDCINNNKDVYEINIRLNDKLYTDCRKITFEDSHLIRITSDINSLIQCDSDSINKQEPFEIDSIGHKDVIIEMKNLQIDGQNGDFAGLKISSRFNRKNSLVMENVNITGCHSQGNGAGLYAVNFEVKIIKSHFTFNWAKSGDGGAIWSNHPVYIKDSVFSDNQADINGGSIFSSTQLTIEDSSFHNGKAANGGGISAVQVGIKNTKFRNNQASESGGAIELTSTNSSSYIYGSDFEANQAYLGGHLFILPSNLSLTRSSLSRGGAEFGGAIYIQDKYYDHTSYQYNFLDTVFNQNSARAQGGAFYANSLKNILGGVFKDSQSSETVIQSFPEFYLKYGNYAHVSAAANCSSKPAVFDKDFDKYMCIGVDTRFCNENNLGAVCNTFSVKLLDLSKTLNNFEKSTKYL